MRLQQLHAPRSHHQRGWACVPSRHICIYHTYILHISIYTCPAMQMNTDRHTNTDSTSDLILHSVWAVWRFTSSKYVCVCACIAGGHALTYECSLLTPTVTMDARAPQPVVWLHLLVLTPPYTHAHTSSRESLTQENTWNWISMRK